MDSLLFAAKPAVTLASARGAFPVHRVFCVGRNYAAHAQEMGHEVDREAPFYFMKDASSVVASGQTLPFPPATQDFHHEMELVVALGAPAFQISAAEAQACVWGYACGLDMTRRDLQAQAKDKRRSWDLGKNFEHSAVIAPLTEASAFGPLGDQTISLSVNDSLRQTARLADMIWSVPDIIADLSRFYHLQAGDLIMTGTPAGVGRVQPGDRLEGRIDGLAPLSLRYARA
ncbi:fumarylacetoacetate hydrolase family protein [Aquimixticola soesokkakensis]|nr:fumarylacetoacetate hydrolase family protein [Aquimixticola soesokkakensis]